MEGAALDGDGATWFLGRAGGVYGLYAGLNIGFGSNDDRAAITENRRRATEAIPGARAARDRASGAFAPDVVAVTNRSPSDACSPADALVTTTPGLLLGIPTADCVPVLFTDRQAGVVGAAHAGWKGAFLA